MIPSRPRPLAILVAAALLAPGCASMNPPTNGQLLGGAAAIAFVQGGYAPLPALAAGLAAYAVVDPAAPNWRIVEQREGEDRFRLSLRMRAISNGGEGEAKQVFARRAAELAALAGMDGYEITGWQEGIESRRPFPERVAEGRIRLVRRGAPPLARQGVLGV